MNILNLTTGQKMWVAVLLSSYARRFISQYGVDEFFRTPVGRALHEMSAAKKVIAEGTLHASAATISQVIPDESFLGRFLNETLSDLPSEVAKDMMNGPLASDPSKDEEMLKRILSLSTDQIRNFLEWAESISKDSAAQIKKDLRGLTLDDLEKFTSLSPSQSSALFDFFNHQPTAKEGGFAESLSSFSDKLEQKLQRKR